MTRNTDYTKFATNVYGQDEAGKMGKQRHEAVLDLSKAECPECEEVGYCEVEGNKEDSKAWCAYCKWVGTVASILDDDADVPWGVEWSIRIIRSQPKQKRPGTPPTCVKCDKPLPARRSVLQGEWCDCKNSPGTTATSKKERRDWHFKNIKGLCTEDTTMYISGAHLTVDEMERLLKDADLGTDLVEKSDMIVNTVLGELFDRKPFKYDLRDMRDNHEDLWEEMLQSMREEVANIFGVKL
jgi:hypothetical protein